MVVIGCGQQEERPLLQVKVLYPAGGLGDRSYSDALYEGLVRASLETEFTLTDATPQDVTEAVSIFEGWTEGEVKEPELLLALGNLPGATCRFGGRHVVILDSAKIPCPNLKTIEYRVFAPSFLAGVAAMAVAPQKTASILAGMDLPVVSTFVRGFSAGVEYAGGNILAVEYLAETEAGFSDPEKARTVAERLYLATEVVFPVAGGSGMGVFEAAKAAKGRYTFGMDVDQAWLGRGIIIGSVVKRFDTTVMQVIRDEEAGKFHAGALSLGMVEEATLLVLNERYAEQVKATLEAARDMALSAEATDLAAHLP